MEWRINLKFFNFSVKTEGFVTKWEMEVSCVPVNQDLKDQNVN